MNQTLARISSIESDATNKVEWKRKKVLHVITGLAMGGAEMMLYKLLSGVDTKRFDSSVISLIDEGAIGVRIKKLGIPVWTLGMKNGRPGLISLLKLIRLVRQQNPDLIQGWMYHGNIAAQFASMFLPNKTKVIWNIRHSFDDLRDEKASTRGIIRLGAWLSRTPVKINYCGEVSALQHENIGYCRSKKVVIPNGFDTDKFLPSDDARNKVRNELGLNDSAPLIGIIGRYHPMKDHENFLRAAALLAKEIPDVHFLLAGRMVDLKNDVLTGLINELGLGNKVHLLGNRSDMPVLIPALDVHCTASAYGESFPNVIGEAMSCGIPCVATDVGDSKRIIGDAGLVVPVRSPEDLAKAFKKLLQMERHSRQKLSTKARARIVDNYSIDKIMREYYELYEEVLTENI